MISTLPIELQHQIFFMALSWLNPALYLVSKSLSTNIHAFLYQRYPICQNTNKNTNIIKDKREPIYCTILLHDSLHTHTLMVALLHEINTLLYTKWTTWSKEVKSKSLYLSSYLYSAITGIDSYKWKTMIHKYIECMTRSLIQIYTNNSNKNNNDKQVVQNIYQVMFYRYEWYHEYILPVLARALN